METFAHTFITTTAITLGVLVPVLGMLVFLGLVGMVLSKIKIGKSK